MLIDNPSLMKKHLNNSLRLETKSHYKIYPSGYYVKGTGNNSGKRVFVQITELFPFQKEPEY